MPASVPASAPLHYCRDKIGGTGTPLHYSLLFLPAESRAGLIALHALRRELDEIADECTDTGVARLKLGWWREELARTFENQPRHPVTRLLAPAIALRRSPRAALKNMVDAAEARPSRRRFENFDTLLADCRLSGGALAELSASLLGADDAAAGARELGALLELTERLCHLGLHTRRGLLPLPLDELARFNVAETELLRGRQSDTVHALLAHEAERTGRLLREALAAVPPAARQALLPVRIRAHMALALLERARRRDYPMLTQRLMLSPLRCLWIAWRVRRSDR
ncbi:MAG: hypothetical protein EPN55_02435 [Gammaproteobacteria bacterium]|nr:MAG: hypothetical protein EPN55_02435 [Gammaproteobacteria bacterium]